MSTFSVENLTTLNYWNACGNRRKKVGQEIGDVQTQEYYILPFTEYTKCFGYKIDVFFLNLSFNLSVLRSNIYVNVGCYFHFSKYQLLSSLQNINFNFSFVHRFPFILK